MTVTATKNERINLRLNQSAKQLIERAATFEGKTVSGFILSSALASAEETVHAHEFSRLNAQDAQRFFDALSKSTEFILLPPVRFCPARRARQSPVSAFEGSLSDCHRGHAT